MPDNDASNEALVPKPADQNSDENHAPPEGNAEQPQPTPPSSCSQVLSYITIRPVFSRFGRCVGKYPRFFLFFAMLLSFTSLGMHGMVLRDNVRDGYTAYDARSRYESLAAREFYGSLEDPMVVAVLMFAKDEGSMHRKEYLEEAYRTMKEIQNATMKVGKRELVYVNMCGSYCMGDDVFSRFKELFDVCITSVELSGGYPTFVNISYPFGEFWDNRIPFEQALFRVKLVDPNSSSKTQLFFLPLYFVNQSKPIETEITNIEDVKLIAVFLFGNKNTKDNVENFPKWELAAYRYSELYNGGHYSNETLIKVLVFGTTVLDMEINEANRKLAPYFAGGFAIMIAFVVFCVFSSAFYFEALDVGKILVAIGATLCPVLAITSTYGSICLAGSQVNSMLFVMPFLVMGPVANLDAGVDSAFLMVYSWQRQIRYNYKSPDRMSVVYEECGPSITITSVTNVLSFGIGALTPTPEVRTFCVGTAVAMGLTFIYQLTLFGSVLAIAGSCEKPYNADDQQRSGWRKGLSNTLDTAATWHCYIISTKVVAALVAVVLIIYWYFSIHGLLSIKTRLDTSKILPTDSPLHEADSLLENYVWAVQLTAKFFVNSRFYITDAVITTQFWDMLKELESLPGCKGPLSSYVWFRNFVQKTNSTQESYPYEATIDPERMTSFLASDPYHFKTAMKLVNDSGELYTESFMFNVVYTNVTDWDIRISLLTKLREVIDRYPDLNVTVFDGGAMFVDQMLSLKQVTLKTATLTLLSMVVVCAVFMPSIVSVAIASLSIASVSVGVIGIMSQMHFDLDPILMASLLMTIGMSVDYIAHISYHSQFFFENFCLNPSFSTSASTQGLVLQ
ncbi:hypothetical protein Q1695_015599 [Nippostrongylus brasiliensis]|nr:hypothetical protein Q1695_015599 [Nippostrongylus brasiliensis]